MNRIVKEGGMGDSLEFAYLKKRVTISVINILFKEVIFARNQVCKLFIYLIYLFI